MDDVTRLAILRKYADLARQAIEHEEKIGDRPMKTESSYIRSKMAKLRDKLHTPNLTEEQMRKIVSDLREMSKEFEKALQKDLAELKDLDTHYTKKQQLEHAAPLALDWTKLDYLSRDLEKKFSRMTPEQLKAEFDNAKQTQEGLRAWKDNYQSLFQNSRGKYSLKQVSAMRELGDAIAATKYREENLQPIAQEMWEKIREVKDAATSVDLILETSILKANRFQKETALLFDRHDPLKYQNKVSDIIRMKEVGDKVEITFREWQEAPTAEPVTQEE